MAWSYSDDGYYDGSRLFSWVSDLSGLPIDQVNFLVSQFLALALAPLFRSVFHPSSTSPATRHAFGLFLGLAFGYFCFGKHALHIAGLPALCYIVMRTQDPHIMQRMVLAVALIYLSCIHLHRQVYDYGSYTLDITGPLMVITQKVTSLAFSLHDGLTRKDEELTPNQKYHVVRKMPTALEYFSYMFHFQALMCGPVIFYRDYIDFIHGHNLFKHPSPTSGALDRNSNSSKVVLEPSPCLVVLKKVTCSLLCALFFVKLIPSFPITRVKESDFVEEASLAEKTMYLIAATSLVRLKYYHAWLLADAICNAAGLGFNGYDKDGNPHWDLISNVDILKFELGLSLHDSIEQWNKGTTRWLRMIVYERAGKMKTVLTYALSALWHGFYPGYYLTFMSGALFTFAARAVRKTIRPYFLGSEVSKTAYDVLTMLITRVIMGYITFSFILLEFWPSVRLYLHMYLWLHILGILALVVLPRLFPSSKERHVAASKPISNGVAANKYD
ncbi:lysophospholipid acyltransferase 6 isoform X1 [Schistocerca cancellata]|uniref:lysophospholipid acyltransferase 6 isoform X1 n=2 Tax=Schistocerca cancellata TaxID=274614 RepID=UPI002118DD6F|nr:lysophospholipid acyltransferase 6 isoform X1 [Schistocerca cancellata]